MAIVATFWRNTASLKQLHKGLNYSNPPTAYYIINTPTHANTFIEDYTNKKIQNAQRLTLIHHNVIKNSSSAYNTSSGDLIEATSTYCGSIRKIE